MKTSLILLLVTVTAWSAGHAAAEEESQAPAPPAQPAAAQAAPVAPAPAAEDVDSDPWNPDLHHANDWPYKQAMHIDTDYCGPPGEFWLRTEYYLWNLKSDHLPSLATTGPAGSAGVPGQAGVATLFGGAPHDLDSFNGGRFTAGVWFESSYTFGVEGNYFFLAQKAEKLLAASTGQPGSVVLARPFVDVTTGRPSSLLIASPGLASGSLVERAPTELQGAEVNAVWNIHRSATLSFDLVAGVRYLEQSSDLDLFDSSLALAGPGTGTATTVGDHFVVRNHFFGGQIGGRADYRWHGLVVSLIEKLALGGNEADSRIDGNTVITTAAGVTTTTNVGLLAQASNVGHFNDDSFAVVNETDIQVGWQFCDYVQAFVGYTFLYTSSVVRVGSIVDLGVNLAQPAGAARPAFAPHDSSFWAGGLNAGVEVRY